jgi:lipoprotein-releasing system permease protein
MFQPLPIFVGLRYSMAREHSFFVSFITWVSLLGVAVGVAALITVISVMNGFETELRSRLLSVSAHATISAHGGAISDWRGRLARLKGAPGVAGAAPFLDSDAMLSNGASMSGAILRGVDPETEAQV